MGTCLIIKSGGGTDTSNATATADKILSGYTIYSNDDKITGSMYNTGNQCKTDTTWGNASGTYTFVPGTVGGVWGGYHDGTCIMQAATLESQTQCDIPNQWWCLTGYSYWANGSKYDGAMINRGTKTWSIGANGSQTIEDGWHDGNGYVNQSIPIDDTEWGSGGATTDIKICWEGFYYTKNRWCYGAGTLVPWNIKSGVTIYGVSGTCTSVRWVVQNGALVNGVSMEWTHDYVPNDDGTANWDHQTNVAPVTRTIDGNTYIQTLYYPLGYDSTKNCWYFSNVGGNLFSYIGSSVSDWKIPSLHIDWAANGSGSSNLCIYYAFGSSGGFSKIVNGAIWTWYSKRTTGSINVTSVSSTASGLPFNTGFSGKELQNGSILIGIPRTGGTKNNTYFFIRNLWFDATTWI